MLDPQIALLERKIAALDSRIKYLEKPLKHQWEPLAKAVKFLAGKQSRFQMTEAIKHAIAHPEDTSLVAGTHYLVIRDPHGTITEYKVNIPIWDEWLITNSFGA